MSVVSFLNFKASPQGGERPMNMCALYSYLRSTHESLVELGGSLGLEAGFGISGLGFGPESQRFMASKG